MKLVGNIISVLLLVLGAVWMLQGAHLLGGSFMTGQRQWLYVGALCALAGTIGLYWINLHGPAQR
jgi:hypothetical protein